MTKATAGCVVDARGGGAGKQFGIAGEYVLVQRVFLHAACRLVSVRWRLAEALQGGVAEAW